MSKKLPVALAVYTVRDAAEKDFEGTMAKVKEMGYEGVELAGTYGLEPSFIRSVLDKVGLKAVSAHVPIDPLISDTEKTIDDYVTMGCEHMAIPWIPEEMRQNAPGFGDFLKEVERIGSACAAKGVKLLYHNHEFEFEKMPDGTYMLDYMFANVPASALAMEPDVCWVKFAGLNPAEYVRKYTGRCPIVHLKDFTGTTREDLEFQPVGSGKQNMPEILQAALDCGAKWVIVEQDQSTGRTPLEAAKISRDYLASLGW
ncbi:MAG: sugar phosphate isomerase/epimerase [Defluviitaleaceae bacterium]|nr:sugar phosphate isomerase/epimerase [Defluviitaleaceae bacterium]